MAEKKSRERSANYKPLLFTTTVRNPERIKDLLWILSKFKDQILTDSLCINIMKELIKYGLYRPMKKSESISMKWKSTKSGNFSEYILSNEEAEMMILENPQNHKEAGYLKGWPSRFATQFDISMEFGFVYLEIGKPIIFSEIGNLLVSSIKIEVDANGEIEYDVAIPENETQALMHALVKYQRKNPFTKVLNDNSPLILLIKVIKLLNLKYNNKNGLSKKEIPLLLYWKNADAHQLFERIKKLRDNFGYTPSDEVIYDICKDEIMEGKDIVREINSIMVDYPDDFIRKMRSTGLISLRGGGRFIDINHNEEQKIDYILKNYATYSIYSDKKTYFHYLSSIDTNLIKLKTKKLNIVEQNKLLDKWVQFYNWSILKNELLILEKKSGSKDEILKFLSAPVRLEFLTAVAIKSKFPNIIINPGYPCDDEGIPTSHASGDQPDIICYEDNKGIIIEVTMAKGTTQTKMEVWPISRHLEDFASSNIKEGIMENMCHFIAPQIFRDSQNQIDFSNFRWETNNMKLKIKSSKILDFIEILENSEKLYFN